MKLRSLVVTALEPGELITAVIRRTVDAALKLMRKLLKKYAFAPDQRMTAMTPWLVSSFRVASLSR
jgi:hypothetical protein